MVYYLSMLVYRLGHPKYIELLDGEGAAIRGGRWNHQGERMIYTAQTSSLAILEVLGHISDAQFHIPYQLIEIEIQDTSITAYEEVAPQLPTSWSLHGTAEQITKSIGSSWLKSQKSAVLRVPSIHNPLEHNYLLNPMHKAFKAKIIDKHWYLYHDRLQREK